MKKNVLVTGGAGFIAHHVVHHIIQNTDWNIVCLDRLDFSGNLNRLHEIMEHCTQEQKTRIRIVFHDLRAELNPMIVEKLGDINVILHLAAGSHVDRSIEYPMEFVLDNVVGTTNILMYANKLKNLEKFIYFSTDEVFGPAPRDVKYEERDRYNSTNPYSATKAGGEEMCVAFENTYGLPIAITHTMNVFGERQHPEKYIPMCIQRVRDNENIFVHSDPSKTKAGTRHYIHAQDVAEGLMFVLGLDLNSLEKDYGGAKCPKFNLVGTEEIDNLSLAKMIAEVQNKELKYEMVDFHSQRPGHDLRYAMSGNYLKSLGWEPRIKFSERVQQVVQWTLDNKRWLK
jgi:dTDP-glucose 4,6-dehydratase